MASAQRFRKTDSQEVTAHGPVEAAAFQIGMNVQGNSGTVRLVSKQNQKQRRKVVFRTIYFRFAILP